MEADLDRNGVRRHVGYTWCQLFTCNNLCPRRVCCLVYAFLDSNYQLQFTQFIVLPHLNTVTFSKHSIRNLSPKLWYRPPGILKLAISINVFKTVNIHDMNLETLLGCHSCNLCNH